MSNCRVAATLLNALAGVTSAVIASAVPAAARDDATRDAELQPERHGCNRHPARDGDR